MTQWKHRKIAKPKHSKRHSKRVIPQGAGITVESNRYGHYLVTNDAGKDVYIQSDTERPGLATTFGWNGHVPQRIRKNYPPGHSGDMSAEIEAATEYLDANDGKRVEDPGYFNED